MVFTAKALGILKFDCLVDNLIYRPCKEAVLDTLTNLNIIIGNLISISIMVHSLQTTYLYIKSTLRCCKLKEWD